MDGSRVPGFESGESRGVGCISGTEPAPPDEGGGPTDRGGTESNVPEDVDERETVGARGLGTGRGSIIRPPAEVDMVDSFFIKVGGARLGSGSVVSEPFDVPAS